MNHIVYGAVIPFVLGAVVYLVRGMRAGIVMLLLVPALMAMSAVWAVVPDIPRVLGLMDLYHRLDSNPRCDIFLWHYSIDKVETESPLFAVGLVMMLVCILFVAWRELCIVEQGE